VALELDMENLKKFDFSYGFLGFYYLFTTIICMNYYGDLEIEFFEEKSVYNNPLILMHITFDFVLLSFVFLQRVYRG
jgi:hypothetical protein